VDVAKSISHYALFATIALVIVVFARQYYVTTRRR
jgi:hypothetical protein